MSNKLPPVPYQASISDEFGMVHPTWADWFKQIFARVGGNISLSNDELQAKFPVQTADIGDAQVTLSKIAANVLVPAGALFAFAGSAAPVGYLLCDGSAVSRTTYSALFSAISTTYGSGDGSTTFNLPNTKGVFLRGAGSQTIGGISYSGTLGASQGDQVQGHIHQVAGRTGDTTADTAASNRYMSNSPIDAFTNSNPQNSGSPISDGANGTPRIGSETRPANLTVNWVIKT